MCLRLGSDLILFARDIESKNQFLPGRKLRRLSYRVPSCFGGTWNLKKRKQKNTGI